MSEAIRRSGGIDEAGYGPRLGPLVVALAAFGAPDGASPLTRLRGTVRLAPGDPGEGPLVVDSKSLYRGGAGFDALERTALAFAGACSGRVPTTVAEWLAALASPPPDLDPYPWYRKIGRVELPRCAEAELVARDADAIAQALAEAGAGRPMLRLSVVPAGEFNRDVRRLGNKAAVLFERNASLIGTFLSDAGDGSRLVIDRHGGRRRYAERISAAFPMLPVAPVEESPQISRYLVGPPGRRVHIEFVVEGERYAPETALASVLAKYTRELFVEELNRHFRSRHARLRPTAGYPVDANRFLEELRRRREPLLARRDDLVRSR